MTTTTDKLSATNFRDPLLRVLGDLASHKANRPVAFKETYDPICKAMGITVEQYGTQKNTGAQWVEKWIQWAFRNLKKEGLGVAAGRGQWALTPQGVRVAQNLDSTVAPMPKPGSKTDPTPKVAPIKGISLVVGPGESEDGYHPDPYIRALAVQDTNCFSNYTMKGGALCERCPLQGSCKNAMAAKLSILARKMAAEDEEAARKAAQAKAQAQMQATATSTPTPTPPAASSATTSTASATPKGGGAAKWGPGHEITIQQQSICKACGKEIQQGSKAIWIRSAQGGDKAGVFHIDCYGG